MNKNSRVLSVYPHVLEANLLRQAGYSVLDLSVQNNYFQNKISDTLFNIYGKVDPIDIYHQVQANLEDYDFILVSAEYSLREVLLNNKQFYRVVMPKFDEKEDYLKVLKANFYSEPLIDSLDKEWSAFYSYIEAENYVMVSVINPDYAFLYPKVVEEEPEPKDYAINLANN